jgi:hypothetical protein
LDIQNRKKNILIADSLARTECNARVFGDLSDVFAFLLLEFILQTDQTQDNLQKVLDAVAAEQLRRSAAYLLGVNVDVNSEGNVSVLDANVELIPTRVTDSLNSMSATDPDALPHLIKLKQDLDLYEGNDKLDNDTIHGIETERASCVARLKASLDVETMVCFLMVFVSKSALVGRSFGTEIC